MKIVNISINAINNVKGENDNSNIEK